MRFTEARERIDSAGGKSLLWSLGVAMRQYTSTPHIDRTYGPYVLPDGTVMNVWAERDVRSKRGHVVTSIYVGEKGKGRRKETWDDEKKPVSELDLRDFR